MKYIIFSFIGGFLASISSVFGKYMSISLKEENYYLFLIYFILNLILTIGMIHFQINALKGLSTLTANILGLSINFLSTSIFGILLFSEYLSLNWMIGNIFIFFGLFLILKNE